MGYFRMFKEVQHFNSNNIYSLSTGTVSNRGGIQLCA